MASNTCTQCRARKIRCDTRLPECQQCKSKGLKCTFYDVSTGKETARHRLYDLMRKASELEEELAERLNRGVWSSAISGQQEYRSYLPTNLMTINCVDPPTASAALLAFMRRFAGHWTAGSDHVPRFAAKAQAHEQERWNWNSDTLKIRVSDHSVIVGAPALGVHRALIEHWTKAVQPEFPLLTSEQLARVEAACEIGVESKPRTDVRSVLATGVYAVSATLIAREFNSDFDQLAKSYLRTLDDLLNGGVSSDNLEPEHQEIMGLLFKVLYHLVQPREQKVNVYTLVTLISRRYMQYFGIPGSPQSMHEQLDQLGICLYILENIISLQLHLPSLFVSSLQKFTAISSSEIVMQNQMHQVGLGVVECSNYDPQASLDEFGITTEDPHFSIHHMLRYVGMFRLSLAEASNALSSTAYLTADFNLLDQLASAARNYIEDTAARDTQGLLCSLQQTAEKVLQAGAILGAHLIILSRRENSVPHTLELDRPAVTLYLVQISALLSSFQHRWEHCFAVVRLWNAFVEFVLVIAG